MSVRKRTWITPKGQAKAAWVVDYFDQQGDRHIETFKRKADAEARHDVVRENVRQGVHTPTNKSITVAEAAEDWIAYVELEAANDLPSNSIGNMSGCTSIPLSAARN